MEGWGRDTQMKITQVSFISLFRLPRLLVLFLIFDWMIFPHFPISTDLSLRGYIARPSFVYFIQLLKQ